MSNTNETLPSAAPGLPVGPPKDPTHEDFALFLRDRRQVHSETKYIKGLKCTIPEAVALCKSYCESFGYVFIRVSPMWIDVKGELAKFKALRESHNG